MSGQVTAVLPVGDAISYLLLIAHPQIGWIAVVSNDVGNSGPKVAATQNGDLHTAMLSG